MFLLFVSFFLISNVYCKYTLVDDYNAEKFADMFDFYTGDDPLNGYVNYVGEKEAAQQSLFKVLPNNSIYIGVDSRNKASESGRNGVRLHSKKRYNHGLFILDLAHIPESTCGVWSIFWLFGWDVPWPQGGEMHIINSVHKNPTNQISIYSAHDCHISNSSNEFSGSLETSDCKIDAPGQSATGCQINTNKIDSGVYVIEWTSHGIQVWHFSRTDIPKDIQQGKPRPDKWNKPLAKFHGNCNFDREFRDQIIILATSFCGFWTGSIWTRECGSKAFDCKSFVRDHPEEFKETYWLINSLKVYSDSEPLTSTESSTKTDVIETTTLRDKTPNTPGKSEKSSFNFYLILFTSIFLLAIIFGCICFVWRRNRQKRRAEAIYALADKKAPKVNKIQQKSTDPWSISREQLIINRNEKLGSGQFGDIYRAKLVGDAAIKRVYKDSLALRKFHNCTVAVKVLPSFASPMAKRELLEEINFMKLLNFHPHVICLLGYVSDAISPLLVIEYCANGDLLKFVRTNRDKFIEGREYGYKIKDLVSYAWQISDGLEYLVGLGFIHRDIAARNVLLDKDNICKISDFGLCRTSDNEVYASKGGKLLPIRWMSIESLKELEYSQKTDVWSFGVLLFELFSLGEVPYTGLSNSEILRYLESGRRLEKPRFCTDEIYNLMLNCWQENVSRPTFEQISQYLAQILETADSDYGYVDAIGSDVL